MSKTMDDLMKDAPLDGMIDIMAATYQKHLTKGDVDALIAFYSGPTGQKMLRELPSIMAEAIESVQPLMSKTRDHMTQRMQQEIAQRIKDSAKRPGDNSTTPGTN